MPRPRKSPSEAKALGASLRALRKGYSLTLEDVANETCVNVGQLSRFERGVFTIVSPNLQVFMDYLQIKKQLEQQPDLLERFSELISRSERHEAAARALVSALERLR